MLKKLLSSIFFLQLCFVVGAQITKAPLVKEGDGPYTQLIIRGVTLINGTGAPPFGPVDIVIEKNRIVKIQNVGSPSLPINAARRPALKEGGKEINCEGMYAMPLICMVILVVHLKEHLLNMFLNSGWHMV